MRSDDEETVFISAFLPPAKVTRINASGPFGGLHEGVDRCHPAGVSAWLEALVAPPAVGDANSGGKWLRITAYGR
jgi:hypothetical protein